MRVRVSVLSICAAILWACSGSGGGGQTFVPSGDTPTPDVACAGGNCDPGGGGDVAACPAGTDCDTLTGGDPGGQEDPGAQQDPGGPGPDVGVDTAPDAPACTTSENCALGSLCVDGGCVAGCLTDRDCPKATFCLAGQGPHGACVACRTDTDCGAKATCVSGACLLTCTGDGDCAGAAATPHCDTGRGVCVACAQDGDCASGTVCEGSACVAGCRTSRDCAVGLFCDTAVVPFGGCFGCVGADGCTAPRACVDHACKVDCSLVTCGTDSPKCEPVGGTCVECLADEDCRRDETCSMNACKAPCTTDADCGGGHCTGGGKCVACLADDECGGGACLGGACSACKPGAGGCDGSRVTTCATDGTGWSAGTDCATTGLSCVLGACTADPCTADARNSTNEGCEFWAMDMDQYHDSDPTMDGENSQYAIVVSNTGSATAQVTVETIDGVKKTVTAPPKTAVPILLDPYNVVGALKAKMGYRVTSTVPVVAYQFNPLENQGVYSNDASLLLPTKALGKRYMVMSWPTLRGVNALNQILASNFAVISAEAQPIQVTVTVTANTQGSTSLPALKAGVATQYELQPFELLNFEASDNDGDLTGSLIEADGRVAVFGGHVCADAPISTCSGGYCSYDRAVTCTTSADCPTIQACDHMEEQIQPITAWGTSYVVPKTFARGKAPDLCRVLAAESGTQVTVEGQAVTVPVLNAGDFFDFEFSDSIKLTASHPVLVAQYLEGQDAPNSDDSLLGTADPNDAGIGDPDMAMVVPAAQYRSNYVFLIPTKYQHNYVSIVAPVGAAVTMDGVTVAAANFHQVGTQPWAVATQSMTEGSHVLDSNQDVGLLVYGWDQYVSYSYPGGMNLDVLQ